MSAGVWVGLALLGGAGAVARFVLDGAVSARVRSAFPFGTLAVNILGSFLLGVLVGSALGDDTDELAGIGFVGAFTTFSTWVFESHRLGEDRRLLLGVVNIVVSLILGVLAAWAGRHLGALR